MSKSRWILIMYLVLMVIGLISAIVLFLQRKHRRVDKNLPQYDERQKIGRGKASEYAYQSLNISLTVCILYHVFADKANIAIGVIVCAMISHMVYGITCILNDSFVTLGDSRSTLYPVLTNVLLGIMMIGSGVAKIIDGSTAEYGVLLLTVAELGLGVDLIVCAVLLAIRNAIRKKESAQETGEDE